MPDNALDSIPLIKITKILEDIKSHLWQAVDGNDLVEEITEATGFCVNSIDYIPAFAV